MDLCITAEEPFTPPAPGPKLFSPLSRHQPSPAATLSYSPSPGISSSPANALAPQESSRSLEFTLIIHDDSPSNDSLLTYPWDVPFTPLRIPVSTSKPQLLALLRAQLPPICTSSHSSSSSPSSNTNNSPATRHPKLAAATLYWTFRGTILPLGEDDGEWKYLNPITKTDLLRRSEAEWFLLREMMAASDGALRCYLCIRAREPQPQPQPRSRRRYSWVFGGNRRVVDEKRDD